MERVSMRVSAVVQNRNNCRTHSKRQVAQVRRSISEFGFLNPILVDENHVLIAGACRIDAATQLGLEEVPAIILTGLSEGKKRALALLDNKIPTNAGWDREKLAIELAALPDLLIADGLDISLTGFEAGEIDQITIDFGEDSGEPDNQFLGEGAPPRSKQGDIWVLGKHRLMCGNARSVEDLDRLMSGAVADMCITDPPYNVRISSVVGRGRIKHPEFAEASGEQSSEEFTSFLTQTLGNARRVSRPGGLHYVFIDWRHVGELLAAGRDIYAEHVNTAVWVKSNAGQGSFYRSQHEQVLIFSVGGGSHANNIRLGRFGRNRSNVWSYAGLNTFGSGRLTQLSLHPTVKPVSLLADAIRDATSRGDTVLDVFAGSGSSVLAAEKVGRRAYALELSAHYTDVAVRRWQDFTGRDAVNESTGRTFDETLATSEGEAEPETSELDIRRVRR